jgi:hypothetical protein
MTDLALRTVTRGTFPDDGDTAFGTNERLSVGDLEKHEADWTMHCSVSDDITNGYEKMDPFLWAPKVIYFQHGSNSVFEFIDPETGESRFQERGMTFFMDFIMVDVNMMQITLLQRRLSEIDAEIKSDQERIKHWEERIAIFADNVLRQVKHISVSLTGSNLRRWWKRRP